MKVGKEIRSRARAATQLLAATAPTRRTVRGTARAVVRASILGAILFNIFALPINVSFNSAQASLAQGSAEVWWPKDGTRAQGSQPFKAMVEGLDVADYDMYWQVDGGQENAMYNSYDDYQHKEAWVDLGGWTWRGQGPYEVTFVAKKDGVGVAKSTINIYNEAAPAEQLQQPAPPEAAQDAVPESSGVMIDVPVSAMAPAPAPATAPADATQSAPVAEPALPLVINPVPQQAATQALYVDPYSGATRQASEWRGSRPQDAALMDILAAQPTAMWLGGWSGDVERAARERVAAAQALGKTALFVAYNIPQRDCGGYSAGGLGSKDAYLAWVGGISRGIGSAAAIVVLEPDALAGMTCLSQDDQERRMGMLASAVSILKSNGNTKVYIDAGHSGWVPADQMAARLARAGLAQADGFSLNVSNFMPTASEAAYGKQVSELTGGKHFVIDTARNGNGSNGEWCNPWGRKAGEKPTTNTGNNLIDAYLWIKTPGESDGTCNGGPSAGTWWADYALSLVR